jgi:SPIRAL1-like protein
VRLLLSPPPLAFPALPTHPTLRSTLATEYNGEVAHGVPQPVADRSEVAGEGAIGVNNNNYSRNEGQNVGCVTPRTALCFTSDLLPCPPACLSACLPSLTALSSWQHVPPAALCCSKSLPASVDLGLGCTTLTPTSPCPSAPPLCPPCSNFITDRPSSRVLAPPGGQTNWSFGGEMPAHTVKAAAKVGRAGGQQALQLQQAH